MNVDFFPRIVYYCDCLSDPVATCLNKKTYSFKNICEEINEINAGTIYSTKCGENDEDIMLSCINHLSMGIFACIRKYLLENYYTFKHVIFRN